MHHAARTTAGARIKGAAPREPLRPAFLPSPLAWAITRSPPPPVGPPARPLRSHFPAPHERRRAPSSAARLYSTAAVSLAPPERRGLFEWLSESSMGKFDAKTFGLALHDALADASAAARRRPAVQKRTTRRYHERTTTVTVDGRQWTQESVLLAYSSIGFPVESVERAMECVASTLSVDGSPTAAGAGASLPEILDKLDIDRDLFIAWQNVLAASDVRTAVTLIQAQASPASMSADGQPLWPPWLLTAVVARAATVAEGHLSIAAIAHHLPYLSRDMRRRFTLETVRVAARLNMVTALPVLVDLALQTVSGDADLDTWLLNRLVAQFDFPVSHRNANQALVNAQAIRVLDAMAARDPPVLLRQASFDHLFRPQFLSTPELHDSLMLHLKRGKLTLGPRHTFALLQRASTDEDDETATKLLEALHARQRLATVENGGAVAEDDADLSPAYFCAAAARFLRSLARKPEEALAYYRSLRRPSALPTEVADGATASSVRSRWMQSVGTTVLESEVAERQCWAILVEIFVRWHRRVAVENVLEMVSAPLADGSVQTQSSAICTADAAMRGLLHLNRKDDVFALWRKTFEDDGLAPSSNSLTQFIWACNLDMTPERALNMLDHWSVRNGLHELLPKTPEQQLDLHYTAQVVRTQPGAPPVVRVPLEPYTLQRLMSAFHELGGQSTVLLRIWRASEARWGVVPSAAMLDELLLGTAYATWKRADHESNVEKDYYTTPAAEADEADHVNWARAPTVAFFLPPSPSEAEPWLAARRIFETVHLSNWPELATVSHPFDEVHGTKLSPSLLTLSTTSIALNAELLRQGLPLSPVPAADAYFPNLPPPSLYSTLAPTANTFHAYVVLLMRHGSAGDIPLALAWMRARGLVPHEKTLHIAVDALYRVACEGPLWHFVVTDGAREDDALCQEENIMFEHVADLGVGGFVRKRRTKRPDLELIDWLKTWCPLDIVPKEGVFGRKAHRARSIHAERRPTTRTIAQKTFVGPSASRQPLYAWS